MLTVAHCHKVTMNQGSHFSSNSCGERFGKVMHERRLLLFRALVCRFKTTSALSLSLSLSIIRPSRSKGSRGCRVSTSEQLVSASAPHARILIVFSRWLCAKNNKNVESTCEGAYANILQNVTNKTVDVTIFHG